MSKVAVASTDGISVDEHFGRSKEFLIYEVEEGGAFKFLERRNVNDGSNQSHDTVLQTTVELLEDMEVVLAKQIGPGAEKELRGKGVIALSINGSIEKALNAYGKRGKFIKNGMIHRSVGGCQSAGNPRSCGCSSLECRS